MHASSKFTGLDKIKENYGGSTRLAHQPSKAIEIMVRKSDQRSYLWMLKRAGTANMASKSSSGSEPCYAYTHREPAGG